MPVLRDVADAGLPPAPACASAVMSLPPSSIVPGGQRPHAHDRLDQLGLAVALDAGDARAPRRAWMVKRDVVEQRAAVGRPRR